jgi:CheY-like chemotaxis protein
MIGTMARSRTTAPKGRARVLVIDDDPFVRHALQRALGRWYAVSIATTASCALEMLAKGEHFDAILCDVMMPHLSGPEFHRRARLADPAAAQRVIFMTGGVSDDALAYLRSVSNPCLDKPVTATVLRAAIAAVAVPGGADEGHRGGSSKG